ncbi:MAG: M3 family oligoendopeptidase [Oscillospiraceae bacterium]|jgi:pepF/M3 family oligoendopeptidase|nr:M3 family oligoendopeptidase [Oscillospiraceae bacterium]
MNKEWDLSPLYTGLESPEFLADFAALEALSAEFNALCADLPAENRGEAIRKVLTLQEKIAEKAHRLYSYAELRSAVNTGDEGAVNATAKLQKLLSDSSAAEAAFRTYVGKTENLDDLIAADPFLGEYAYLLRTMQDDAKYTLDEKVEEALAKMNLSGGSAWENLQAYLTSTVTADYRGEKLTLSAVRNLAYDPDPAVRKDAYEAEVACYDKIRDGVCFALNSLKQQVTTECELRKGGSPLEMTLRASRMKKTTLDAMIRAIEEYLPVFWKYLRAKAKLLGYEGGLKWWDLFAPMGKNTATYTVEDAKQYLLDHFRPFAPDMADMMAQAFDEAWIDFYPHAGKVGGAFCANLPMIRQSRVLTNFDGAFGDIVTLAHELGHAYHGMMIEAHRPLNLDYSMPVAETASTFNETVVMNAALDEATDPEVKLGLLESQLQDTTQIMCDIMSRYWFETAVFEKAKQGFAFPDELCEMMKQAQKRGYGDGLDLDTLNPYMWVCKSHYYSAGLSFYNFPYAFGGLFAAGLYAQYRREGEAFLPKYRALLKATTVSSVEDVARMADIDLGDVNFWRSSLEIFKDRVEQFLKLAGAEE